VTELTIASLPDRCLRKAELADLVQNLAARPDIWAAHVGRSSPERRHFASIHRDEYVDVWLICWAPGNDTGWHDHDISSGAVCVIRGALEESTPRIGGAHARELVAAGRSISFGPDHIHRLTGEIDETISLHAYSPPLWRLGQYTIDDDGIMRRMSVCYADELRPLDAARSVREPAAAR
jgi:predicted metal-dependent enzyme (double-stranded beta helix superfamily)